MQWLWSSSRTAAGSSAAPRTVEYATSKLPSVKKMRFMRSSVPLYRCTTKRQRNPTILLPLRIRQNPGRRLQKSSPHVRAIRVGKIRTLDHEHVDALRSWIDPCLGAEGSAVAKRAGGKRG